MRLLAILLLLAISASAQAPTTGIQTEVHGRVIRLKKPPAGLLLSTIDFDHHGVAYAIQTADGKLFPILPTDTASAIYNDSKFRERDLLVTARLFPATSFIEVIKLQSLREGRRYDLYYFCDVCNITTHKPGPCPCCQAPVVFRETPAETDTTHP
jgi:hypothetical protein